MHLYELTAEYRFLEIEIEAGDGDTDALQLQLDDIVGQLGDKAENIGKYILSLKADSEAIKTEIDRLATRRKAIDNKAEWLKSYLLSQMIYAEIDKIKKDVLTISVRTNPPSINIENQDEIPTEYRRVIPETWEPDKKAILEHVKATGEIVPGCHIVTDKKSLVVR